ncbi:tetratricopeptide repeat protein [Nocardia tenerifensis]|uniref:Tetratricopeptide repeat protein n=1 Tax=Nocardia tenerifensis TaxID=228006 RepID=A0A318JV45_9NOCA|nr:tetratricopeptide repeat protein [Nocardia tenerifensis]PXX57629.1 tetratricopeptide repeat protein [Nocardia tenerifensis]
MAIYLPATDTLLLEVPKTGSKWLRAAVAAGGVEHRQVGPESWRGHGDLTVHPEPHAMVACFVRDPVRWYRSYFAWRTERGWRPRYELDRLCAADTFTWFVRRAATTLPGFLSGFYRRYTGPPCAPIDFVGRTERLADDLVRLLRLAGADFDEAALRATPPVNTTGIKPQITTEIEELIHISEFHTIGRFDYGDDYADRLRLRELGSAYPEHLDNFRRLALWAAQNHWKYDDAKSPDKLAGTRHARNLTNFGLYAQFELHDLELAGRLYRRAVAEDPAHPRSLGTLAVFLDQVEGDIEAADRCFREALRVRPRHPEILGNYALFMKNARHDFAAAEELFLRAIAAKPDHARNLGNYATFLHTVLGDYSRAETYYRRAIAADPDRASFRGNYDELRRTIASGDSS